MVLKQTNTYLPTEIWNTIYSYVGESPVAKVLTPPINLFVELSDHLEHEYGYQIWFKLFCQDNKMEMITRSNFNKYYKLPSHCSNEHQYFSFKLYSSVFYPVYLKNHVDGVNEHDAVESDEE
jgi:hypothetical protein